jgi:hypothetical protein
VALQVRRGHSLPSYLAPRKSRSCTDTQHLLSTNAHSQSLVATLHSLLLIPSLLSSSTAHREAKRGKLFSSLFSYILRIMSLLAAPLPFLLLLSQHPSCSMLFLFPGRELYLHLTFPLRCISLRETSAASGGQACLYNKLCYDPANTAICS